jgi:hypothetical protein
MNELERGGAVEEERLRRSVEEETFPSLAKEGWLRH